jgi:predicted alpha/beta superfamily hydrolase
MTHRASIFSLLVLFVSAVGAAQPVVVGQGHRLSSALLKEERTYRVHLPASYAWAKDRRYPVLYVLDGKTHFLHTSGSAGYLAAQGEIPEMIVVAIDSTVRIRDFTQSDWSSVWIGGGGAANFKRFLSSELIPNIERAYRTDGFRVLAGHSAGGQFVLYCLTSEPSLFQAYLAFSPSLDWDDNLPQKSLAKSFESTRSLKAFLYVARSDDSGRPLADYERLVETLKTSSPQGFRWYSQAYPDETHGSIALLAQIDSLRRLYSGYRFHSDLLVKGLESAEKHFEAVSRTVGWPFPVPEGVVNELGYEALSAGKTEAAIALFKRNVQANPSSANAHDGMADAYEKSGNWIEAAGASQRAAALAVEFDLPNREYFVRHAAKLKARLEQESTKSQ